MSKAVPILFGAAGSAALGIAQSRAQERAQERAELRQQEAQRASENAATAELRAQEQERRRLRRRQPDVLSLLDRERLSATGGVNSTLLTRGTGTDRGNLGRAGSLGA